MKLSYINAVIMVDNYLPVFEMQNQIDILPQKDVEVFRWAPSAANMQTWRIVKDGDKFHFYEKHTRYYDAETYGDVQKIDMGIALCHFMSVTDGKLTISYPGIAIGEDMEYIATVRV